MRPRRCVPPLLALLMALAALSPGPTRAAVPEGVWLVGGKVAVRVFDCAGLLCGRIVWLANPALRTPEMCGRTIIWGLQPNGAAQWDDGRFYDPEDGKTYDVKAELQSPDTISARVYLGMPFFGRTETLRRVSPDDLAGRC